LAELLHVVGAVFAGTGQQAQRVNPQTGAIEDNPNYTRTDRIAGVVGNAIRGAAAGAAAHGPGAVGQAALLGMQAGDAANQQQQQRLLAQSANVRATNEQTNQNLITQASLAKSSLENARYALDLKAAGMQLDQNQVMAANSRQELLDLPGAKVVQHFDSNKEIGDYFNGAGGPLTKQHAQDLAQNKILLAMSPGGGFDAIAVPKDFSKQPIGEGHFLLTAEPDPDDPSKLVLSKHEADPSMPWGNFLVFNDATAAKVNATKDQELKQKLTQQQINTDKSTATKNYADANLADSQSRALINTQTADPFGNTSTLPAKELLKRQDSFQKDTVNKAYDTEKAYQMSQQAYSEYLAAQKQGKELPTGAQSMLLLSQHLGTTFGNVKGSRITKDMIQEHLGARGLTDDAVVAIQRLTNGDQLSSAQWSAFSNLIAQSRNATWSNAVSSAKNQQLPITFLPRGNGRTAIDKNTAQLYLDAADGDPRNATAAAQKQGWLVQ
jgi:hypothetical protein